MEHYIGVDIVEIARIKKAVARWGDRFLNRLFTESELKLYRNQPSSLAARFAGKEAAAKALSPQTFQLTWKEIEILAEPNGRPSIRLYGKALVQSRILGLDRLNISLSHSRGHAIAFVMGTTSGA